MGFLSDIFKGVLGFAGSQKESSDINKYRKEDLEANRQNWADQLRASRFNRSNPFQSVTWSQGPDGGWSQETKFSPEQQNLQDKKQAMQAARMAAAAGIDLSRYGKGIDYNAMGLGHLGQAAGAGPGTTGKRPWADSPWASAGGEYLNYMSNPPPGMIHQLSANPWMPQAPMPTGGGAMVGVQDVATKLGLRK